MSLFEFAFLLVLCLPGVMVGGAALVAALGRLKGRPFEGFLLGCLLAAFGRTRTLAP